MAAARSSPALLRVLAHATAARPDAIGAPVRAGYRELLAGAARVAAEIRRASSQRTGARIAFLAPPGLAYVQTLLGAFASGGTAIPLSPLHTAPELSHILTSASPDVLVATHALAPRLADLSPGRQVIILDGGSGSGGSGSKGGRLGADDGPDGPWVDESRAGAPALILYTSGTTGRPKGVLLTHDAIAATLSALETAWQWRATDRLLHVLPLHHTHGLVVALLGALWAGASVRFATFEAEAIWDRLGEATVFMAVPTMYAKLMEAFRAASPERRAAWATSARRLRLMTSGSAALPGTLLTEISAATGQVILERYGMTEIGMALSNPFDGPRVPGSVGLPLPGVQVDIVTEDGQIAPVGQPGELRVRSPQMFVGYDGDAAATASAFDEEGRFRTGDTGLRDRAGYTRLLGRTSIDVLKSGGYKISALEIEEVLREHPALAEVAVVGIPDETWGDRITACAVLRAGARLELDDLKQWARERLAPYKLPRALELLGELPKNPMGKVQKHLLRDRLAGEAGRGSAS